MDNTNLSKLERYVLAKNYRKSMSWVPSTEIGKPSELKDFDDNDIMVILVKDLIKRTKIKDNGKHSKCNADL